jgi:hypothetical protein
MTSIEHQVALRNAIDRIDPSLRVHYEEAQLKAPTVVESESSLVAFLHSESMDFTNAATKLATYWKYRKEVFGSRAFLPLLDLSGNGALDDSDVYHLRMGSVVALPEDDKGRKVLCLDYLRCQCTIESIPLRCWFYILSTLWTQNVVDLDREVVIILIEDNTQQSRSERLFVVLKEAFPVKVVNIHCCYLQSEQLVRENHVAYFLTFLRQIFHDKQDSFVKVHVKTGQDDLYSQLQVYGLHKENLPTTLGGSWLYVTFRDSIDKEAGKTKTCNSTSSKSDVAFSTIVKAKNDECRVRKRINDLIYARKRRQQDKQEEIRLKQKCAELRQKNAGLWKEHIVLTDTVAKVKHQISIVGLQQIRSNSNHMKTVEKVTRGTNPYHGSITPSMNTIYYIQNFIPSTSTTLPPSSQCWNANLSSLNGIEQLNSVDILKLLLMKENIEKRRLIENIVMEQTQLKNRVSNNASSSYNPTISSNAIFSTNHLGTMVIDQNQSSILNQQLLEQQRKLIEEQHKIKVFGHHQNLYHTLLREQQESQPPPLLPAIGTSVVQQNHSEINQNQLVSDIQQLIQMVRRNETSQQQENNYHRQEILSRVLL